MTDQSSARRPFEYGPLCRQWHRLTDGANFNIGGGGSAATFNATSQYLLGATPVLQNATYIAGIYGNVPSGALPVVVNANGQLGTTTAGIGVTTFNGRTGAVVPAANDYSFSQLSGSVSFNQVTGTVNNSQFAGTYTNPVVLSNTALLLAMVLG